MPTRKAIDYARQIAEGLAAAHDKGIVHRDLKPENLFITSNGRVKILDFGIAKLTRPGDGAAARSGATTETDAGVVVGTAGYRSPEQVRGDEVDPRSDLFSFGAILYELLSGCPAFARDTTAETMTAILKEDPPGPLPPGVSPSLERIVSLPGEDARDAVSPARDRVRAGGPPGTNATQPVAPAAPRRGNRNGCRGGRASVATAAASWLTRRARPSRHRQPIRHRDI